LAAYEDEITSLIRERDRTLAAHQPEADVAVRDDRALEVTSELRF
jgi:hypothetical protein